MTRVCKAAISVLPLICMFFMSVCCASCASSATSAEEYYSLGMAYYDMGKFEEAGKWLARASSVKKTMNASEYHLGRIAFETGRYTEALRHFERLIKLDSKNTMALKSAAYTEILLGNLEKADTYYARVLRIEPDSADDGYNHALVLYAMKKYAEAEVLLEKFSYAMPENKNTLILLARAQHAQKKVEAIDTYALWLANNSDPLIQYEYIEILQESEFYSRAIDETRKLISSMSGDTADFTKAGVQFLLAKLLLTTDPQNAAGMTELQNALDAGYFDKDALNALMDDNRVLKTNKAEIQKIITDKQAAEDALKAAADTTEAPNAKN